MGGRRGLGVGRELWIRNRSRRRKEKIGAESERANWFRERLRRRQRLRGDGEREEGRDGGMEARRE